MKKLLAVSLVVNAALLTILEFQSPTPRAEGAGADPCAPLRNGNVNGDLLFDVSDAIYTLNYLFSGGSTPKPSLVASLECAEKVEAELSASSAALAQVEAALVQRTAELTAARASLADCQRLIPREPLAPSGLAATAGDGQVSLDWTDNTELDLASYSAYRSTRSGGGYVRIAQNLLDSKYADASAANGTTYYYVITAVDDGGLESAYSGEVKATPQTPPPPPLRTITLAWDRPAKNTDGTPCTDLGGYKAYRGTASGRYNDVLDVGNLLQVTFGDLPTGDNYFSITAYDSSGNESPFAGELRATVQ